jgi:hypothetical protein
MTDNDVETVAQRTKKHRRQNDSAAQYAGGASRQGWAIKAGREALSRDMGESGTEGSLVSPWIRIFELG